MTSTGRMVIALASIVAGMALIFTGQPTAGVAIITLTLGYGFGDRNGEKRLAAAIVDAQSIEPAMKAAKPKRTPPKTPDAGH